MKNEKEENEWKELSPSLASRDKSNSFTCPANYFEGLPESVQTSIFLSELNNKNDFSGLEVPENYFKDLTLQIETLVSLNENIKISAPFAVPDNYFAQLQQNITSKISIPQPAKIKTIKLWSKLTKYAVAASLLIVSSVGIYRYTQPTANTTNATAQTDFTTDQFLYDIDENTIIQHINTEQPIESKNVSTTDVAMENYLISHYTANELVHDL